MSPDPQEVTVTGGPMLGATVMYLGEKNGRALVKARLFGTSLLVLIPHKFVAFGSITEPHEAA